MSKTSYWDKRKVERYLEAEKIEKQYKKKIQSIYKQAYKNIDEELRSIYKNYSNQTGLDQQQLKQILTKSETKKTFEELKKQGLDKYVLENYKARINRLEQIQAQMYAKAKKIYPSEAELQKECFTDVMRDGYYRTIYDIEKGTGNIFQFSAIDDNTITRLLNDRWSGENYSTRIWTNTDILADNLQEIIGGGLLSGQSYAKISRQIRDRFNVAKYYSDRLARTEVNYFNNQVDALANQELGFDKYVIVATLDNKTSDICQDQDHRVYEYSKMEVGDNYPPFHPNCRTTVRAYLGEFEKNIKRTAIDPTTNERVEIDNIPYKEWYNRYGLGGSETVEDIPVHKPPKLLKTINDVSYKNILKELKNYENIIKSSKIENAIVITQDGEVYRCYGDKHNVYPDVDLKGKLIGAYVTHNHPDIEGNIETFTSQDRNLFYTNKLRVLRGISKNYNFEMNNNKAFKEKMPTFEEVFNKKFDDYHLDNIMYSYENNTGYKRWKNDK